VALYDQQAPPAPGAEPGYYRDPLGARRARWWSGEAWTAYVGPRVEPDWPWEKPLPFPQRTCKGCGLSARTWATQCAQCGRSYSRASGAQMAAVIAGAIVLGLGGCAGLVGVGLWVGEKELSRHEISRSEFESVRLGTSRGEVEARFGEPIDLAGEEEGCSTYYEQEGGGILEADFLELCFDERERLASKRAY